MSIQRSDRSHGRDWRVLLVGGASGVGKTSVARDLARRFDVPLSQVDTYRLMLERSTTAELMPALHRYACLAERDDADADALCAGWSDVAREVTRALEIVVAFHAATDAPVILEGDTILPTLATSRVLAGVPVARRVRSVFLHEPSEVRLAARFAARGRGYEHWSAEKRRCEVRRSLAYGRWLADEALRHGCPVVVSGQGPSATADAVFELLSG